YPDLVRAFQSGSKTNAKDLLGYWVGRCVNQGEPRIHWPAFFNGRIQGDGTDAHFSHSYTWIQVQTDKYDSYTLKDLQEDDFGKSWLNSEQWNKSYYYNFGPGSPDTLINDYYYNGYTSWRMVRNYFD